MANATKNAVVSTPDLDLTAAVSAAAPDEREALIRLGAQAAKDRDARNVAQVVTATVDAILAARPVPEGHPRVAELEAEVERMRKNRNECHRAEVHYLRRLTDAETALAALRGRIEGLHARWLGVLDGTVESSNFDRPTLAHCQESLRHILRALAADEGERTGR